MPFPEPDPEAFTPIFVSYCIDYRYNAASSEFLDAIEYEDSYYLSTNAGASLPLGYKKSCKNIVDKKQSNAKCCLGLEEMDNLKKSFVTNLKIALTLKPITVVYLLNHQDCGAIRAFLPCSGYPKVGQEKKDIEICIHAKILTYGEQYVKRKFESMDVILGLIDSNGSVADYDTKTQRWIIIYEGSGKKKDALWYGYKKDDVIVVTC